MNEELKSDNSLQVPQFSRSYRIVALVIILATALLVSLIGVIIYTDSQASVIDLEPTNITDSALTLVWRSDTPYIPQVLYKLADQNWQVDEGAQARYTHHVTIRNLNPDTKYKFKLKGKLSGRELLANITTKPLIAQLKAPDPAYGNIDGLEDNDAIVKFTDPETKVTLSSTLSQSFTYTTDTSSWELLTGKKFIPSELIASVVNPERSYSDIKFSADTFKPL